MKTELNALEKNNTWVLTELPPSHNCIGCKWVYKVKYKSNGSIERYKARLVAKGYTQEEGTYGFHQSKSDCSFFIKSSSNSITVLCVYVDDIISAGNDLSEIQSLKAHFDATFTIKDLGTLKYILGIEVARSEKGISLCQRKYALDVLTEAGYLGCKPTSTPMDSKSYFSPKDSPSLVDPSVYRRLVGRLLYLTITRPELSYRIQYLSQYMSQPTDYHLSSAHRVLRYVKANPGKGIFYPSASSLQLKAYSDADWAKCTDTRRSISGYAIYLGEALISWKAKKQPTISRSSIEAEYRAIALTTCELQWISYLFQDVNLTQSQPAAIYTDSRSAYCISQNPCHHERTKHIQIDCHFVREKIQQGLIKVLHIPSSQQVADMFTKALSPNLFHHFISKLGMIDIHAPTCGGC
ncbi:hypothetical protein DH2020_018564 [Rehmannia glutinosa]|uniref:Reverse transcriptase Ty1/copia-type domain-containing protein n=1 Tax=Rehmannia glutinosa TaxID=99300 RepID=A0ABR0WJN2_REHGL